MSSAAFSNEIMLAASMVLSNIVSNLIQSYAVYMPIRGLGCYCVPYHLLFKWAKAATVVQVSHTKTGLDSVTFGKSN